MIKKILIILAVSVLAAGLFGCGGGNSTSDTPTGVNPNVVSRVELLATSYVNQTNGYCYLKTKVIDGNGSPIKNRQVVYTNLSTIGVLDFTSVNTDANGIATATLYSTVAGFATVQAEVNADNTGTEKIRDRKTVFFTPFDMCWGGDCGGTGSNLASLTLDVDSNNNGIYNETSDFIMFDPAGKSDAIIRATVLGSSGAPLLNSEVTFGSDSPEVTFPLGSSTTAPVVHTNIDGQASVLARVAPTILRNTESTVNITAKADNNTFNVLTLFLKPVVVNTVTVAADPSTVDSEGASVVSAIVKTNAGNPVPANTVVNFTASAGSIVPFGPTDATGKATAQFKAPKITSGSQSVTVTASVGGKSGSATITVRAVPTQLLVVPGSRSVVSGATAVTTTFAISGGTGPYTTTSADPTRVYNTTVNNGSWTGSAITATIAPNACPGDVELTVYDAVGASVKVKVTITASAAPLAITPSSASICEVDNTCSAATATQLFTITGGAAPYSATSGATSIIANPVVPAVAPYTFTANATNGSITADTTVTITITDKCSSSTTASVLVVNQP